MPPFAARTTLKYVLGERTMLCDDFLVSIAKCDRLEQIALEQCRFTDAGVTALDEHSSLQFVYLSGNDQLRACPKSSPVFFAVYAALA
jgi:hypothetical protein